MSRQGTATTPIDRHALVARHTVVRTAPDPRVPLQVGNGEFAFAADITGLQSLTAFNTLSHWGWHTFPEPDTDLARYRGRVWPTHGRDVTYPDMDPDEPELSAWLVDNPHRLNLARIGLMLVGRNGQATPLGRPSECHQRLDLWTGVLSSRFTVERAPVSVTTCCHGDRDTLAVRIDSPLLSDGRLVVFLDFPYGDGRYFADHVGDWASVRHHDTSLAATHERRADLVRTLDSRVYHVGLRWDTDAELIAPDRVERPRRLLVRHAAFGGADVTQPVRSLLRDDTLALTVDRELTRGWPAGDEHVLEIEYALGDQRAVCVVPRDGECRLGDDALRHRHRLVAAAGGESLEFTCSFSPEPHGDLLPGVADTFASSARHWPDFWRSGGAVDLSASSDGRARELERRIVLSQYVMAVNEAGSLPPQESGLVNNGWTGKFHFEMYLWHAAHWALWGRWPRLRRSLDIYRRLLPSARERAREQGFRGARWPKCTGPEGRETPHEIHALLLWQQPHVFFFAELDYRAHPTPETLEWWRPILHETAEFLASFAFADERSGRHVLGPPLHVVSENTSPAETSNPTFELAYWRFGLTIAQAWRERLGLEREPGWDEVLSGLAELPVVDGVYVLHEGVTEMWERYAYEHPALTGIRGLLPGHGVDEATMRATLERVFERWRFDRIWGWDFPMLAMCAARLGQPERAVETLLHPSEGFQFTDAGLATGGPFPYFPSNGGLLYAVAMLCAGWDGAPDVDAPGFPRATQRGSRGSRWVVRHEGLYPAL